jgi:hypothetical protein
MAMITNQTHAEKLMSKAKFTSAERCASNLNQASQHTLSRRSIQFLSLMQVCPSPWWTGLCGRVCVYNLHDWLRLQFRGGHRGRADMIGEQGQKLNLVGVLKDKEVTHRAGILWFWGNWGLEWLTWNRNTKYIINPWAKWTLKQRFLWTMIILKLAV